MENIVLTIQRRPAPARSTQLAPRPQVAPAPPAPVAAPNSGGPGLFGQMAATAGGVAVGSAVGHLIGGALTGAFSGGSSSTPTTQQQPVVQQQEPVQQYSKPCEFEMQQFLECSKNNDLSLCEGFNDVLKQCRMRYGL
uniref:CHCH domain-containing protein n=1 Tax=Romanomermis culicivorax TaxID=13658 RepID=A0A915IN50_ROMCU